MAAHTLAPGLAKVHFLPHSQEVRPGGSPLLPLLWQVTLPPFWAEKHPDMLGRQHQAGSQVAQIQLQTCPWLSM